MKNYKGIQLLFVIWSSVVVSTGCHGGEEVESTIVDSVSPAWASSQGGTTVTIRGSGFELGYLVDIAGISSKTTFVSEAELQAIVPENKGATGKVELVVHNEDQSVVISRSDLFGYFHSLAFTNPIDTNQTELPKNINPSAIIFGDFDHDKKADVIIAQANEESMKIYLGKNRTDAGLQKANVVDIGQGALESEAIAMSTADINGDGNVDLLLTLSGKTKNILVVLIGKGDGTFKTATTYQVGATPGAPLAIDLNGDMKLDVVIATKENENNFLRVFLNKKGTTLDTGLDTVLPAMTPSAMAASDFNKDGKQDLVLLNQQTHRLHILQGNGAGSFSSPQNIDLMAAQGVDDVLVADMNKDGNADIVVLNRQNHNVSILLGAGDASFTLETTIDTEESPQSIHVADMDQDGKLDLVMVTTKSVKVRLGEGAGIVQTIAPVSSENRSCFLWVSDQNEDGKSDIWLGRTSSSAGMGGDLFLFLNQSK